MTAIKSINKVAKSLDVLTDNQDPATISTTNAKCHQEVAMAYHEITNQIEQEYYSRARGCSVRAQKDNLFDYTSWM